MGQGREQTIAPISKIGTAGRLSTISVRTPPSPAPDSDIVVANRRKWMVDDKMDQIVSEWRGSSARRKEAELWNPIWILLFYLWSCAGTMVVVTIFLFMVLYIQTTFFMPNSDENRKV